MTKEQLYADQLKSLGIYEPAFEPAIHSLAILEREHARAMKEWKKSAPDKRTAPSVLAPQYEVITRLRRDILTARESLGLTPKGLQRLRGKTQAASGKKPTDALAENLDAWWDQCKEYDDYEASAP